MSQGRGVGLAIHAYVAILYTEMWTTSSIIRPFNLQIDIVAYDMMRAIKYLKWIN